MNDSTAKRAQITELFTAIDAMDTATFLSKLAPDAEFCFGNAPPVRQGQQIGAAVDGFFSTIAGLRHELTNFIADGASIACEGIVTYTRHDGTTVTLPFADTFAFDGDLIESYRIYIDIGPLYATTP